MLAGREDFGIHIRRVEHNIPNRVVTNNHINSMNVGSKSDKPVSGVVLIRNLDALLNWKITSCDE